ncbi:hypothetical protein SKAU_G00301430 [Synaphobranchus kaupii]|uniref:Uncharacterized protein n=1 Tax=Synaphobranchus kaupii TaxID=118154 RepID=A0A9Q1EVT7_SYNKA|nr:hypothetical protein SKAU_G00301430 [Synaphobranchus kaupii]
MSSVAAEGLWLQWQREWELEGQGATPVLNTTPGPLLMSAAVIYTVQFRLPPVEGGVRFLLHAGLGGIPPGPALPEEA